MAINVVLYVTSATVASYSSDTGARYMDNLLIEISLPATGKTDAVLDLDKRPSICSCPGAKCRLNGAK